MKKTIKPNFFLYLKSSCSGFTLLEIMAAVSILAIVLVSVYKMYAQTISMSHDSKFYATAPFLAKEKLADIMEKTMDNIGEDSGDFGEDFTGYTWRVRIDEVESETLAAVADDLKKITLTVSFNNKYNYNLVTCLFSRN